MSVDMRVLGEKRRRTYKSFCDIKDRTVRVLPRVYYVKIEGYFTVPLNDPRRRIFRETSPHLHWPKVEMVKRKWIQKKTYYCTSSTLPLRR